MIEAVARSQLPAPRIVDDYHCTEFGRLYNCLNFTTVPHALASSLSEKKINSTFLIAIAALKEGIAVNKELQPVFGGSPLVEILSNGLRDEHARKEKAELRQEIEMIQGNDAGTIDGTAGRPHANLVSIGSSKNEQT
jgi:hypothetical protein